jgi:hypothetical protein
MKKEKLDEAGNESTKVDDKMLDLCFFKRKMLLKALKVECDELAHKKMKYLQLPSNSIIIESFSFSEFLIFCYFNSFTINQNYNTLNHKAITLSSARYSFIRFEKMLKATKKVTNFPFY